MREIKFRAWNPNNPNLSQRMVKNPLHRCDPDGVLEKKGIYQDWILMQFTGLHDKNGKEIYEQDIVSWRGYKGEVYFDKGRFWVKGFNCTWQDDPSDAFGEKEPLEVVGNIYENPKLLA